MHYVPQAYTKERGYMKERERENIPVFWHLKWQPSTWLHAQGGASWLRGLDRKWMTPRTGRDSMAWTLRCLTLKLPWWTPCQLFVTSEVILHRIAYTVPEWAMRLPKYDLIWIDKRHLGFLSPWGCQKYIIVCFDSLISVQGNLPHPPNESSSISTRKLFIFSQIASNLAASSTDLFAEALKWQCPMQWDYKEDL